MEHVSDLVEKTYWSHCGFPWVMVTRTKYVLRITTVSVTASVAAVMVTAMEQDSGNLYLAFYGAFVFFSQFGYLMVSSGSVKAANLHAILSKHLLTVATGAIAFYIFGFSLAFQGDNSFVGGTDLPLSNKTTYCWFFEFGCAVLAATIATSALAERARFEAHILATFLFTSWVYPVVAHWVWSQEGWLSMHRQNSDRFYDTGLIDVAGSGVVHMVGGLSSLAGALIMRSRKHRFTEDGRVLDIPGNCSSFVLLGSVFLWFSWYSLNDGRTRVLNDTGDVSAICAVNTTLSAVSGGLMSLLLARWTFSGSGYVVWDVISTGNGIVAGLVSISASCAIVPAWAAILIGLIGSSIYFGSSLHMPQIMKVDDQLDSISMHAFTGAWGLLAPACFAKDTLLNRLYGEFASDKQERLQGFIMGGNGQLLAVAITGIIAISLWVVINMFLFYYLARLLGILEYSDDDETMDLQPNEYTVLSRAQEENMEEQRNRTRIEFEEVRALFEQLKQEPRSSEIT